MNTHDIELPPHDATASVDGMNPVRLYSEAKVRAAIEADRQRNSRPRPNGQYFEGVNIERLRKALTAQGIAAPESLEELAATLARHINALTMQVADRKRRGEPVAYLRPDQLQQIRRRGTMCGEISNQPRSDLVAVFAAPQPADPTIKESLTVAEPVKVPSEEIIEAVKAYGLAYSAPNTTATELTIRLQEIRTLLARYGRKP